VTLLCSKPNTQDAIGHLSNETMEALNPSEWVPIELSDLHSRTHLIYTLPASASVAALREEAARRSGVPSAELRLRCGTTELHDATLLSASGVDRFPVRTALRLFGGKGGFGAMLRTAGKGGVKTTNFDACRDLNGRRLRHVNSEAKLREWEANADERKRKKAEDKARRGEVTLSAPPPPRFDDDEYEEMLEAARSNVRESVSATTSGRPNNGQAASSSTSGGSSAADALKADSVGVSVNVAHGAKRTLDGAEAQTQKAAKLWADPLAGLDGGSDSDDSAEGIAAVA